MVRDLDDGSECRVLRSGPAQIARVVQMVEKRVPVDYELHDMAVTLPNPSFRAGLVRLYVQAVRQVGMDTITCGGEGGHSSSGS